MSGVLNGLGRMLGLVRREPPPAAPPVPPAVFHITHQKAGSQWINRIFHTLAFERMVQPKFEEAETHDLPVEGVQFLRRGVEPGMIYPTLYVTREQFESVRVPKVHHRFVVVRDLRDTLVSAYFSYKHSHAPVSGWIRNARIELNRLSPEDGMLFMLDQWVPAVATFQWSWAAAGDELIKYEDLLADDEPILARVLLRDCKLGVDPVEFSRVVRSVRFEAWTGGRRPGDEDVGSHERKGIAGDWRNHFTDKVARAFRSRYGSLLIATGYETNERW